MGNIDMFPRKCAPIRAVLLDVIKDDHEKPPRQLFHYTSAGSLLGILESKGLWATNIHFLNDRTEQRMAMNMLLELAESKLSRKAGHEAKMLEYLEHVSRSRPAVYLASFSENGDDLSQWRSYCTDGGYAAGFDGKALEELCQVAGFTLIKCRYDEHEGVLAAFLDNVRIAAQESLEAGANHDQIALGFVTEALRLAPFLKDDHFRVEQEWRAVSNFLISADHLRFRSSGSILVPYVSIPLPAPIPISRIVVGPSVNSELARLSLSRKLEGMHTKGEIDMAKPDDHLVISRVPYRPI